MPHAPQLFTSVPEATQFWPQASEPVGQLQPPALQPCVAPHWTPQLPQFAMSAMVFTQDPLQLDSGAEQAQLPPTQVVPGAHGRPQPPQWAPLVVVSTQVLLQEVRSALQLTAPEPPPPLSGVADGLQPQNKFNARTAVTTAKNRCLMPSSRIEVRSIARLRASRHEILSSPKNRAPVDAPYAGSAEHPREIARQPFIERGGELVVRAAYFAQIVGPDAERACLLQRLAQLAAAPAAG